MKLLLFHLVTIIFKYNLSKNFWYPSEIKIASSGKEARILESRFAGNHYWNKVLVSGKELTIYSETQLSGESAVHFAD